MFLEGFPLRQLQDGILTGRVIDRGSLLPHVLKSNSAVLGKIFAGLLRLESLILLIFFLLFSADIGSLLSKIKKHRNFLFIVSVDASLFFFSFWGAYYIRFEYAIPSRQWELFIESLPFVLTIKMSVFSFFHLYRGMWRYTDLTDILKVIKAVGIGSLLVALFLFMLNRLEEYPRSIFLIDGLLAVLAIGGVRAAIPLCFLKIQGWGIFPFFQKWESTGKAPADHRCGGRSRKDTFGR